MGLRFQPRSPPLNRPARDSPSESDPPNALLSRTSGPSPFRPSLLPTMVTTLTKSELIESNARSDDCCLVVISNKVYDLTLWLEEEDDSLAREIRRIGATDPVGAGCRLADRLGERLEDRLAECRIGDFESVEITPACLDPGGSASGPTHMVEPGANSSNEISGSQPNNVGPGLQAPRPSHLTRALALVEFHKSRVIEAQTTVGSAHVELAEALGGLAEAEKKRDHLVMLACEGCRPTLPEWEDFGEGDQGRGYPSGSA